jgi:iron complex transport system permease protein
VNTVLAVTSAALGNRSSTVRSDRLRTLLRLVGPLLLLAVLAAVSLAIGSRRIPASHVVDAIFHFDGSPEHRIVREARVPRALLALLVGAALAAAGTLMQGLTRNPLADPGILGIEAGAALGAVIAIQISGWTDLRSIVWFAFAGAAVAATVVLLVGSSGRNGASPVKLALAGAATAAALTSITTGILLSDPAALDSYRFWVVGSLNDRGLEVVTGVAPFILVGLVAAFVVAGPRDCLALGHDGALGLGVHVGRVRLLTAITAVLLAGAAVAAAGPIGFVGLAVPHLARRLVGQRHRLVLACSLVLGPVMLLTADVLGRVLAPGELQAGVVTAVIGAPVLVLVVRQGRATS